jgi:2-phosphoglycerate kinase
MRVAKLFIIESDSGERIPFLRGVLVESLVRIGLAFQDAYEIAQSIRDRLEQDTEISTATLKKRISAELQVRFGSSLAKTYELGSSRERQIMVQTASEEIPFSVGILSRSLEACAINRADALATVMQVQESLQQGTASSIDHVSLRNIVYEQLRVHCSQAAADRFLSWRRFKESGRPLIVLVGGITGTGKSTLTTELAYLLNVVRTQSTDMMREIVRCYLPPAKAPSLAYSSFEAWLGLCMDATTQLTYDDEKVIKGFLNQFEAVKAGLEATIHRAGKERHDLIIDGVHVLPWKLNLNIETDQAIVVPLILVVPKKKTLGKRLKYREREQPDRNASRYLEQLDQIWILQSYLVSSAEEQNIPLIYNGDIEEALDEILRQINRTVMQYFPEQ